MACHIQRVALGAASLAFTAGQLLALLNPRAAVWHRYPAGVVDLVGQATGATSWQAMMVPASGAPPMTAVPP